MATSATKTVMQFPSQDLSFWLLGFESPIDQVKEAVSALDLLHDSLCERDKIAAAALNVITRDLLTTAYELEKMWENSRAAANMPE